MKLVFIKDVFMFSWAQGIAGISYFCYMFITARLLGVEDYGLFQAVMGIYGILIVFGSPLNIAAIHSVATSRDETKPFALSAFLRVSLVVGSSCSLFMIVLSKYFTKIFHARSIWPFIFAAFLLIASTILTTLYGGLQGRNQYLSFSLAKILESLLVLLIGTGLIAMGLGASGAVAGYFFSMCILCIIFFIRNKSYSLKKGPYSIRKDIASLVKPLAVFGTLLFVINFPVIIARVRLTEEMAGFYGTLFSLRNIVMPFAFAAALPLYSRTVVDSEERHIFFKAFIVIFVFSCSFLILGLFIPEWFINFFYGSQYLEASDYIVLYGCYLALHMACMIILFQQAAKRTLKIEVLLIPILIIMILLIFPDLSINKILIFQIIAWGAYLLISLFLGFPFINFNRQLPHKISDSD